MAPTAVAKRGGQQLRNSIIDEVERDHEALANRVIAAIVGEVSEYGFDDAEGLHGDVRAHCDANIRAFLAVARAGRVPVGPELEFVREATRRRVSQGVPLDAVLHSFRIGHRVVWDALVERAERSEHGSDAAVGFARISMSYVDTVCTCVADTYLTEQQQAIAEADRSARDLLELILAGDPGAARTAEQMGLRLTSSGRYLTLVADTGSREETGSPTELAGQLRRTFPLESRLIVVRQGIVVCVLACETTDEGDVLRRLEEILAVRARRDETRISVGLAGDGLNGIVRSHRQAVSALAVCGPERPLVAMSEVSLLDYLIATADEPAVALIPARVRDLALSESDSDRAMVETLEAFASTEMNVHRTAEELPAHPNTVRYRLSRVAELTGIHWRDPVQVVELLACIRLARRSAGEQTS